MPHFVIMGSGRVGAMLACALQDSGHSVAVIDQEDRALRSLGSGFQGKRVTGHGFDRDVLRRAGIEQAHAFAAVTAGDNTNILAARVARETFGVQRVVARIYDPGRAEFFQRLGIPTVAAARWTADQVLRRMLPEQRISGDWQEASGRLQLGEVALHEAWTGLTVETIEQTAGIRVAYLTRFGEGLLPGPETSVQSGDLVHAMMRIAEVEDVARVLASPPDDEALARAQALRADETDERSGR